MDDYRFRFIEIEEDYEDDDDEFEDDEEIEIEDEEFEGADEEFGERVIYPIDLDHFHSGEFENDDEFDDELDDEIDDDDVEDDIEEDEELMLNRDPIEDDEYEDEEEEEEEDYGEEDEEELIPVEMTSPRVSSSIFRPSEVLYGRSVRGESSSDSELCEGKRGSAESGGGEVHGLSCPICFEAWTSGGEHQICCLPCGHIYGLSCIKKWLQQSRSSGKCPQCNNLCTFKDVRVLYASRLCVADEELHKRVLSLEAKCAYLEQKAGRLTPDELIDQICNNPAAVQRLATVLAQSYRQPVSP